MASDDKPSEQLLLTVTQAGALLGFGRSTVYELIKEGQIPVVRLGPRRVRVPRRELERWIADRTVKPKVQGK